MGRIGGGWGGARTERLPAADATGDGNSEGHAFGLVLGALLVAVIAALVIGFGVLTGAWSGGRSEVAYGTVLTVNVSASDSGLNTRARVRTADGERTLDLPNGIVCWPGDRIELWKRGKRYRPGLGGCSRP